MSELINYNRPIKPENVRFIKFDAAVTSYDPKPSINLQYPTTKMRILSITEGEDFSNEEAVTVLLEICNMAPVILYSDNTSNILYNNGNMIWETNPYYGGPIRYKMCQFASPTEAVTGKVHALVEFIE